MKPPLTVGDLRRAIEGLSDDLPVSVATHFHADKGCVHKQSCGGYLAFGGLCTVEARPADGFPERVALCLLGADNVKDPWSAAEDDTGEFALGVVADERNVC